MSHPPTSQDFFSANRHVIDALLSACDELDAAGKYEEAEEGRRIAGDLAEDDATLRSHPLGALAVELAVRKLNGRHLEQNGSYPSPRSRVFHWGVESLLLDVAQDLRNADGEPALAWEP